MFDSRAFGPKLGTGQVYNTTCLRFVPATDAWEDPAPHQVTSEKLAYDVVTWTCRQPAGAALTEGATFTVWVVIDRATRVTWVECSAVKDQRAQHPRALREACEFPSGSLGTVSAHVFLRMGETWLEVRDSVEEAYHAAKDLLDQLDGWDHSDGAVGASADRQANEAPVTLTDLQVTDGAVGIRTSQLTRPVHLRTLKVSGKGSVGIDLDDGGDK
jgi:hypothetical protein